MQIVTLFDLPIPHFVIFAYAKKNEHTPNWRKAAKQ